MKRSGKITLGLFTIAALVGTAYASWTINDGFIRKDITADSTIDTDIRNDNFAKLDVTRTAGDGKLCFGGDDVAKLNAKFDVKATGLKPGINIFDHTIYQDVVNKPDLKITVTPTREGVALEGTAKTDFDKYVVYEPMKIGYTTWLLEEGYTVDYHFQWNKTYFGEKTPGEFYGTMIEGGREAVEAMNTALKDVVFNFTFQVGEYQEYNKKLSGDINLPESTAGESLTISSLEGNKVDAGMNRINLAVPSTKGVINNELKVKWENPADSTNGVDTLKLESSGIKGQVRAIEKDNYHVDYEFKEGYTYSFEYKLADKLDVTLTEYTEGTITLAEDNTARLVGDTVKFTVEANPGYEVTEVAVNGEVVTSETGTYTYVTKTAKTTITVKFAEVIEQATVTVKAPEVGSVSITNADPSNKYDVDTVLTLTHTDVDTHTFKAYTVDGKEITGDTYKVEVGTHEISGVYTKNAEPEPTLPEASTFNTLVKSDDKLGDKPTVYAFGGTGKAMTWPGVAMTKTATPGVYGYNLEDGYETVIFAGNGKQTIDIPLSAHSETYRMFNILTAEGKLSGKWCNLAGEAREYPTAKGTVYFEASGDYTNGDAQAHVIYYNELNEIISKDNVVWDGNVQNLPHYAMKHLRWTGESRTNIWGYNLDETVRASKIAFARYSNNGVDYWNHLTKPETFNDLSTNNTYHFEGALKEYNFNDKFEYLETTRKNIEDATLDVSKVSENVNFSIKETEPLLAGSLVHVTVTPKKDYKITKATIHGYDFSQLIKGSDPIELELIAGVNEFVIEAKLEQPPVTTATIASVTVPANVTMEGLETGYGEMTFSPEETLTVAVASTDPAKVINTVTMDKGTVTDNKDGTYTFTFATGEHNITVTVKDAPVARTTIKDIQTNNDKTERTIVGKVTNINAEHYVYVMDDTSIIKVKDKQNAYELGKTYEIVATLNKYGDMDASKTVAPKLVDALPAYVDFGEPVELDTKLIDMPPKWPDVSHVDRVTFKGKCTEASYFANIEVDGCTKPVNMEGLIGTPFEAGKYYIVVGISMFENFGKLTCVFESAEEYIPAPTGIGGDTAISMNTAQSRTLDLNTKFTIQGTNDPSITLQYEIVTGQDLVTLEGSTLNINQDVTEGTVKLSVKTSDGTQTKEVVITIATNAQDTDLKSNISFVGTTVSKEGAISITSEIKGATCKKATDGTYTIMKNGNGLRLGKGKDNDGGKVIITLPEAINLQSINVTASCWDKAQNVTISNGTTEVKTTEGFPVNKDESGEKGVLSYAFDGSATTTIIISVDQASRVVFYNLELVYTK